MIIQQTNCNTIIKRQLNYYFCELQSAKALIKREILLLVFVVVIPMVLWAQSPERPRKEIPLITDVISTLEEAEGWMLQNNGEWISSKNQIPFKDYALNKRKSGRYGLGKENFDHVDLRSITINNEIYSILLVYAKDGNYEFPVLEENWNDFNTLTYYVFKESKWNYIFPDSMVFNVPYAVNTNLVATGVLTDYNEETYLFEIENHTRQAIYQQAEGNTNLIFAAYPVAIRDKKYFRFKLYETINKREIYVKYLLPYNRDKLFRTFYYELDFDVFAEFVMNIGLIDQTKIGDPGYYLKFMELGKKKFDDEEYRSALQLFVKASMVQPPDSAMISIFLWKGKAKLKLNSGSEALDDFDSAINRTPKTIQAKNDWLAAHFERGNAYYYLHQYPNACEDWNFALQNGIGEAFEKIKKNCDRGSGGMMRPINIEKSAKYFKRAMKKYQDDDYLKALHLFEKSWQYNYLSKDFNLPYYVGMSRFKLGDYVRCIDEFDQAAALEPESFSRDFSTWTNTFVMRGKAWLEIGYTENACSDWHKAKELGNADGEALLAIHCPDYKPEKKTVQSSAKVTLEEALLMADTDDPQTALENLNNLEGSVPKNEMIKYYAYRGSLKHKTGDYQGAINDFTKAIDQDVENSGYAQEWIFAHFNRGISKFKSGDQAGACLDWQKAIDLGLSDPDALEYLYSHCRN
jgi:tetratricopeptide (TPR) repeat protein